MASLDSFRAQGACCASRLRSDGSALLFAGSDCGPGYRSPLDAMRHGPREKVLYIPCIQPTARETQRSDYLATIDVDPSSPTYSKVRCVPFPNPFQTSTNSLVAELQGSAPPIPNTVCPEPLASIQRIESPNQPRHCKLLLNARPCFR
jgi:hypothetical protein